MDRRYALVALLVACTHDSSSLPNATSHVIEGDIPQDTQPQLDLLIAIDDSPAMAGFHQNVVANAASYANVLSTLPSHLPDLHIAVATGDLADGGAFRPAPGGAAFLDSTTAYDGTITTNFTGTLSDAMTAMFDVGAAGGATSQPLAAATQALATHPDFLRDGAVLAIEIIGAADDASTDAIATYAQGFKSTKSDPDNVTVSVVAGTGCMFDGANAVDATRLRSLVDQFPNRGVFTSICQQDLSEALELIADLFKSIGGLVCLPATTTECSVSDVVNGKELGLLPACDAAIDNLPCFALAPDPSNCTGDESLGFVVHRKTFPPMGDHVVYQCVVED